MWRPTRPGYQACDEHGQEFPVGHVCPDPSCVHQDAGTQAVTQAEAMAAEAATRNLGSTLDREARLIEIENAACERARRLHTEADRLWTRSRNTKVKSDERDKAMRSALHIERVAILYMETQRKSVSSAGDYTAMREEQLGTEHLEHAADQAEAN